jgi:hypothetical protein
VELSEKTRIEFRRTSNKEMKMNKVLLVAALAFGVSTNAAFAFPMGSQPGLKNDNSEIVQIKQKKKMKGGMKSMKGMKGMDHSKMKM